jgi:subtilase family serine protease
MSLARTSLVLTAAVLAGSAALLPVTSASAAPALPLSATLSLPQIPGWAATAKVLGATPASQTVYVSFALAGKDPAGEKAYGEAVSTPGNALYRDYLSKEQFEERFGAQPGAATAVLSALEALGVTTMQTDAMGLSVLATMPASLASSIFKVTFHQLLRAGVSLRIPETEPVLPASLRPWVSAWSGLSQTHLHTDHTALEPVSPLAQPTNTAPVAYFNAGPESTYYGSKLATNMPTYKLLAGDTSTTKPYLTSGYTPAQLRGAYGVADQKMTGKGVTVGVALFYDDGNVGSDLTTFSKAMGLPAPSYDDLTPQDQGEDIPVVGDAPVLDPLDAGSEQTLDVEAIHQMAPDAAIDFAGAVAPEDATIYVALVQLMNAGVDVINNSYGGTGDTDAADATEFEEVVTGPAMTMGVGLDFSSGDAADNVAANAAREVDFPASSDEVTAVGGTLLEVGKANNYQGEAYWGTYSTPALGTAKTWGTLASQPGGAGGGGGVSTYYPEPSWQQGVVPAEETENKDTGTGDSETSGVGVTTPGRVVPDVAMLADSTTGILVGETQETDYPFPTVSTAYSYFRIGGTSVSSPLFTGLMADVDQALGKSAGFVDPTLYSIEKKDTGAFRDPQIGRSPTGRRLGSTAAQILTGCASANTSPCTGTGPGVVPVIAEVRPDYTDTANDGVATATYVDPTGLAPVETGTTPGNAVVYHLRGEGVLGTLEDLPGYDDSTGLGSPYAPAFIQAFVATKAGTAGTAPTSGTAPGTGSSSSGSTSTTASSTGELAFTGANPLVPMVALFAFGGAGGAALLRRRRR